jgi:ribosomal protein S27AE
VTTEGDPACGNNMTMGKRQCLECGGELVMAFHPSGIGRLSPGAEKLPRPNAKWRCSTCGQALTAEQLRADKRARSKVVDQA